jgi:hypothetical protein
MRKLTLNLETVDVQSFHTTQAGEEGRGTVEAHMKPTGFTLCVCPQSYQCPTPACPSVDPNTC